MYMHFFQGNPQLIGAPLWWIPLKKIVWALKSLSWSFVLKRKTCSFCLYYVQSNCWKMVLDLIPTQGSVQAQLPELAVLCGFHVLPALTWVSQHKQNNMKTCRTDCSTPQWGSFGHNDSQLPLTWLTTGCLWRNARRMGKPWRKTLFSGRSSMCVCSGVVASHTRDFHFFYSTAEVWGLSLYLTTMNWTMSPIFM